MSEPKEPTRWKHGAAGAPEGFAELAHADAHDGPSDAALGRVIDKLALQVSAPEIARAFHATTDAAASRALRPTASARFGVLAKWIAGACVLVVIAIGLLARPATRVRERAASTARPPVAQTSARKDDAAPPLVPAAQDAIAAPAAAPATPAPAPPRGYTRVTHVAWPEPPRMSELRLLELAQHTLRIDPARALALAERHRRDFPRGQFAQEREMLAIQALVALGQTERAAARARAFARSYPDSSHLPHLRDLVHTTP